MSDDYEYGSPIEEFTQMDYQCPKCHKYFGKGSKGQERLYNHYQLHQNEEDMNNYKKFRNLRDR